MARSLGEFEQLLLFAVLRLGDGAYGVAIRREIAERTGRDVAVGAVYTGLDRLQSRGYVSSAVATGPSSRRGRRRKFYRLEKEGAAALAESYDTVRRMAEGAVADLRALAGLGFEKGEA